MRFHPALDLLWCHVFDVGRDPPGDAARILDAAESGLRAYHLAYHEPSGPAERRLAFRELGLAIGLRQANRHAAIAEQILDFWLDDEHRRTDSWMDHRNINDVMLATALLTRA